MEENDELMIISLVEFDNIKVLDADEEGSQVRRWSSPTGLSKQQLASKVTDRAISRARASNKQKKQSTACKTNQLEPEIGRASPLPPK